MKKIIVIGMIIGLLTGCGMNHNTPTNAVENVFQSYQNLDSSIINELDEMIEQEKYYSKEQKKEYKNLLEKQYQNLSYKIVKEEIIEDTATVEAEIEVLDYSSSLLKSKKYYLEHQEEFSSNVVDEKTIYEEKSFIDYKLKELGKVTDKMKYSITFSLIKKDTEWEIEKINELDIQKIQGLY